MNSSISVPPDQNPHLVNSTNYRSIDELPLVMRVEDVGEILGIARGSAYALVREGRIRSIRVSSNRLLIPKEAVIEFLQSAS